MRKPVLLASLLTVLLATAPALAQEPEDQYSRSTASLEPVNVYGLSVAGCEGLLSQFGVEETVTFGTPPEQVWYCLSVVDEIPPAAPAADGEPLIGDLPCPEIPEAVVDCVGSDLGRIRLALEVAGVEVAGNTFPPPRVLPDTGGLSPLVIGAGTLLSASGVFGKLIADKRRR